MLAAFEQAGVVALEKTQLAELRERMAQMGADVPDEMATAFMDQVEERIALDFPTIDLAVKHTFTDGLYGREIFMPAGVLLSSRIHMVQHQFVVLSGMVMVWSKTTGNKVYPGGYEGVTEPGTRRILFTLQDTRFKTFHPNPENLTDPDEIVARVTKRHDNPLLNKALGRSIT